MRERRVCESGPPRTQTTQTTQDWHCMELRGGSLSVALLTQWTQNVRSAVAERGWALALRPVQPYADLLTVSEPALFLGGFVQPSMGVLPAHARCCDQSHSGSQVQEEALCLLSPQT